jgi:N-acetyl-anhydromuramyl-L-alanine amidase AmpD
MHGLAYLNGIKNPDKIRAGAILRLPELTTDTMDGAPPEVETPATPPPSSPVPINRASFVLPQIEYYPETTQKDLIVLHFTAGRDARGAFNTWLNNPEHVGTSYIVDADGTIYELFDPSHWAYHLGIKGVSAHDRRSIGIEIANVGPLKPSPTDSKVLNWWPNNWGSRWCGKDQAEKYVEANYRGIGCFASFPEAQMNSIGALVSHLCDRFGIKKIIPPANRRSEYDLSYFRTFKGIAAHQNFRADKWDVGPAFDWNKLGL